MNPALQRLSERRLLIVMGKGGTGKTTIAAALGTLAARHGAETAVIEVSEASALRSLLASDLELPAEQRQPVEIAPHLYLMCIAPKVALQEYLELRVPVRRLARAIIHNPAFEAFLDAAPGWRELITLGKIWHLEQQTRAGRPRYDLLIVDAPATGHGLSLLSVPSVVLDSVRLGPLRRHTDSVWKLLRDPERTLLLPVSQPEELPVKETLELYEQLRALGLRAGAPIANCVESSPAIADVDLVLDALSEIPAGSSVSRLSEPSALAGAVRHRLLRARLQRQFIEKLRLGCGSPPLELPYLAEAIAGPEGVGRLADALESALEHAGNWA